MTKKDKNILLKDLCARLPYGVKCNVGNIIVTLEGITEDGETFADGSYFDAYDMKPYLRPMSSMTDEERKVYESFIFTQHHVWDGHGTSTDYVETDDVERYVTWLNKNMFDYMGLIPMGLALEAPENMYKTE